MKVTTRADVEKAGEVLAMIARCTHSAVTEVSVEVDERQWEVCIDLWIVVNDVCDLQEVKGSVGANMDIAVGLFESPAGVQLSIRAMVRRKGVEGDTYESAWRLGGRAAVAALECEEE